MNATTGHKQRPCPLHLLQKYVLVGSFHALSNRPLFQGGAQRPRVSPMYALNMV